MCSAVAPPGYGEPRSVCLSQPQSSSPVFISRDAAALIETMDTYDPVEQGCGYLHSFYLVKSTQERLRGWVRFLALNP